MSGNEAPRGERQDQLQQQPPLAEQQPPQHRVLHHRGQQDRHRLAASMTPTQLLIHQAAQVQRATLEALKDSQRSRVSILEDPCAGYRSEIKDTQNELKELKKSYDDQKKEIWRLTKEVERLKEANQNK